MKKQLHNFSLGALQAVVSTSVSMMASSQAPPTKPADFEKMLKGTSINLLRGRISRRFREVPKKQSPIQAGVSKHFCPEISVLPCVWISASKTVTSG